MAGVDRLVKCMRPFDVVGEGIGFVWQVINRNFTSKENGTVGVNVGDFVYIFPLHCFQGLTLYIQVVPRRTVGRN